MSQPESTSDTKSEGMPSFAPPLDKEAARLALLEKMHKMGITVATVEAGCRRLDSKYPSWSLASNK